MFVPPLVLATVLVAVTAGVVVGTRPTAAVPLAVAPQVDDLGGVLYGRDCAGCHGPDGQGSGWGPTLEGTGRAGNYYVLSTGRMPIDHPGEPVRRSDPVYTEDEVRALLDHIEGLVDGPDVPELLVGDVDLARGGALYRLHCGVCHSSTGIGTALAYGDVAPPVLDAEPAEVAAVMAAGAGAMPAFYPNAFTDEDLTSIVAYVQQLRDPVDRGVPFGRAGRVDEALAAWGVGLASLLLLAAWIARAPAR